MLFSLNSDIAVEDGLTDKIINSIDVGESLAETFRNKRLIQHNKSFHEPIKRNLIATFKDTLQTVVIKRTIRQ